MIIEDSALLRDMLSDVLSSVERIAVVAEAEDRFVACTWRKSIGRMS
jgi:chemotaxis response regulator CheB